MSAMKGVQLLFFSKKVSVPVVLQKSKLFLVNSDRGGCEVLGRGQPSLPSKRNCPF